LHYNIQRTTKILKTIELRNVIIIVSTYSTFEEKYNIFHAIIMRLLNSANIKFRFKAAYSRPFRAIILLTNMRVQHALYLYYFILFLYYFLYYFILFIF